MPNLDLTNYQTARNALIKPAEREANAKLSFLKQKTKLMPGKNGEPYPFCYWTQFFHEAMNRMAKESGLVK